MYTVARDASLNLIHIKAIREKLPRNLARLFPAVLEEVELSLDELVPPRDSRHILCLVVHSESDTEPCGSMGSHQSVSGRSADCCSRQ